MARLPKPDATTAKASTRGRGRPSRISRDQLIEATLEMLAADGLEPFSMARLAARVDASPMALYTYFSGRDALLEAASETIFGQFEMGGSTGGWEPAIRAWLDGLEHLFRRWPVALKLIKWDEQLVPACVRIWLPMAHILREAGLRGERLAFATSWFGDMAMSLMVGQFRAPTCLVTDAFLGEIPPQERALAQELLDHADTDRRRAIFEHGVDATIAALRALIEE
ncbi:helix-turn-helix transcriptional regulator [Sphingomonas sp. AP4-R1]|uniref:TetR/AcrR family transcriptional regulator n=1 Tax=Sphingomonas sp. AP4-R1 TaxID=2735134 RepID=UPI0014938FBA|nr:helix-turn-helix domain-containing protein [Sphingomonas sp. AP4-R1]QJU58747.1 helix-turn-helix transcriptional regulator [Sphingomonas sp. AP4-R1]